MKSHTLAIRKKSFHIQGKIDMKRQLDGFLISFKKSVGFERLLMLLPLMDYCVDVFLFYSSGAWLQGMTLIDTLVVEKIFWIIYPPLQNFYIFKWKKQLCQANSPVTDNI